MNRKNIPALLLLCSCVCSLILAFQLEVTYASEYRMIDLFTQRGGKGLNQTSDAFAPQEEVILYANLTYRGVAVANKNVAFEIHGPINPVNNISFSRTAMTNASGIASLDFRIPWPTENPEIIIFGTWIIYASADIAEVQVEDTLTFEVVGVACMIDLYSEKPDPYNGKGPGMPSDAFEPQEGVTLYAEVTCDGDPVINKLVAFMINGPINQYVNLTVRRTVATDDNGVACVEFRVPWSCEHAKEVVIGNWTAYAYVSVVEITATDIMPFKVGWLVEIVTLETGEIDAARNWVPKTSFKRGECIGVKLTVENICFTNKTVTLTIIVYDKYGFPIAQYKANSYTILSGSEEIQLWCYLHIPSCAFRGIGTIYANAFKTPGRAYVPYCPEASAAITIVKT